MPTRIYNRDIFNTEESGGEDPGLTLLRKRSLEVSEMAKGVFEARV